MKCQGRADETELGLVGKLSTGLTLQTGDTCRVRLQGGGAGEAEGRLGLLHKQELSPEISLEHNLEEGHDEGRANSGVGMAKERWEGRDVASHM